MPVFRLEIECKNATFSSDPVPEVRRILKRLVVGDRLREDWEDRNLVPRGFTLLDYNGNAVGRAYWEGD